MIQQAITGPMPAINRISIAFLFYHIAYRMYIQHTEKDAQKNPVRFVHRG